MESGGVGRLVGYGPIVAAVVIAVAGVLAVAGYGVPVGVGLLSGAGLGFGVGFLISLSTAGASSRMVSRSRGGGWTAEVRGGHAGDELRLSHERAEFVEGASLVSVVAGPVRALAGGLPTDLVALELRSTGGVAHLVAALDPDRALPAPLLRATVRDDAGTGYAAGGFQVSGSSRSARFRLVFAPQPPPEARRITIEIAEFVNPFPLPPEIPFRPVDVRGPWRFEVDLPRRPA